MPAWLVPMRQVCSSIFEWIGSARRHVQARLVLCLVTIGAFDREDAMSVRAPPQTEGGVRATFLAQQRRISRRVAIDTSRMHEYLVGFQKCFSRLSIVARGIRAAERAAGDHQRDNK